MLLQLSFMLLPREVRRFGLRPNGTRLHHAVPKCSPGFSSVVAPEAPLPRGNQEEPLAVRRVDADRVNTEPGRPLGPVDAPLVAGRRRVQSHNLIPSCACVFRPEQM